MTEQEKAAADTALVLDLDEAVRKRVAQALMDLAQKPLTNEEQFAITEFLSSPAFIAAVMKIAESAINSYERQKHPHYQKTWISNRTW